jgi:hypothetical protein
MTTAVTDDILQIQSALEAQRVNFDTTWQRIADLCDPDNALFLKQNDYQGQRRDWYQFDSTGQLAAQYGAAAMESVLTPQTMTWHGLEPLDESLRRNKKVMAWCEERARWLFRARYLPAAGFVPATSSHYKSLFLYGNGCTFVDDVVGRSLRYSGQFVGDLYVATDHSGLVDRVHRRLTLTKSQAIRKFGADRLPKKVTECKSETQTFAFLHAVYENVDEYDPRRRDSRGMRFRSNYVFTESGNEVVQEGGYRTMPYVYSMFSTAPREVYGRGPASFVLNTLNTINEQQKTLLRAGQRAVDPPLLLPDDDVLEGFNMRSGALNFGGVDAMGNARVMPLNTGANLSIGLEFIADSREVINAAFFVNLFQILVENPRMTATEALLRAQEKGQLLGPPMGRQQSTYLSPMIERELDIMSQVPGFTDDMPPELVEAGGLLNIRYTAPINRMQRAEEVTGLMAAFEQLTPWAQVDQTIMSRIFNPMRVGEIITEVNGVPMRALNTPEEIEAMDEQAAQAQQAEMLLAAAPVAGKTALDLARANQIGGGGAAATGALLGG